MLTNVFSSTYYYFMAIIRDFAAAEVSTEICGELQNVYRWGIESSLPGKSS